MACQVIVAGSIPVWTAKKIGNNFMDKDIYKLALATDLISFLVGIMANDHLNKVTIVHELLNKWSERVERSTLIMKKQVAAIMAERDNIEKDVAMILLDINNVENTMIRGEFKSQIRESIYKKY